MQKQPPALTQLITAFSREQKEKIYVQHRLREKSAEVKQMVADGGYIFVCGATSMGKQAGGAVKGRVGARLQKSLS